MIKNDPEMIKKNEDDKINDKKMMNAMITKMIKIKIKKMTWPSLWLPFCHKCKSTLDSFRVNHQRISWNNKGLVGKKDWNN